MEGGDHAMAEKDENSTRMDGGWRTAPSLCGEPHELDLTWDHLRVAVIAINTASHTIAQTQNDHRIVGARATYLADRACAFSIEVRRRRTMPPRITTTCPAESAHVVNIIVAHGQQRSLIDYLCKACI
jgi:hypothetical protein